jgi:hypothetical protein
VKRKKDDLLEQMQRVRDRLSRHLEQMTPGRRSKEVERLARKALDEAGVELKRVKAAPKRIRRLRKSG